MKRILYKITSGSASYWRRWGMSGILWRLLLFLVMLFLLFVLLFMFRPKGNDANSPVCEKVERWSKGRVRFDLPDDFNTPSDTLPRTGSDRYNNPERDNARNRDSIPGGMRNPGLNLPDSDENLLPPVTDDRIEKDRDSGRQIVSDRINVILDDTSPNDETFKEFARQFKVAYPSAEYKINYYNTFTKLIQATVPPAERERVKAELPGKITGISFKVFDETMFGGSAIIPNDVGFKHKDMSWYMKPIQAYEAWEITKGSREIVVAVVDSYFDLLHDEIGGNSRIVSPYSVRFRSDDVRPTTDCPTNHPAFYHGTAVAAQAVGIMDNGKGLCGIAPACRLMPVSMGHQFTSMTILEGLLYAIYQGADVVNISAGSVFGSEMMSLPVEEQIAIAKREGNAEADVWQYVFDLADRRNVTIVWASGNSNLYSSLDFSKRGKNTIRVAAVNNELKRAVFSNFGNFDEKNIEESTISAPGTNILCAFPSDNYCVGDGTSYSAPIVTGAVALMKSIDPTLTNKKIIDILKQTGKPIAGSPEIGNLLQIKGALDAVNNQFSEFDELMANPDRIIGIWQSVEPLYRVDANGVQTKEKVNIYFQVSSKSRGRVLFHEYMSTGDVYSAECGIGWKKGMIYLKQSFSATSPGRDKHYIGNEYVWSKNADGKLQSSHKAFTQRAKYLIKKISDNPNLDIKNYE